jgi:hypothetical protein
MESLCVDSTTMLWIPNLHQGMLINEHEYVTKKMAQMLQWEVCVYIPLQCCGYQNINEGQFMFGIKYQNIF